VLEGHTKGVTSVAFDGSGKYLASGGSSNMTYHGGGCLFSVVLLLLMIFFVSFFHSLDGHMSYSDVLR
jgi:hypothetical protein